MKITPFHAARLVDEDYQIGLPLYKVDTSTVETLLESVEAITKSSRTAEEIKQILAVVKAKAGEMLTEEESAKLFNNVGESDGTPYSIKIGSENYPLIYEALDQLTAGVAEPVDTTELETKLSDLESQVAAKEAQITELTAKLEEKPTETVEGDYDPEGLKAKTAELETEVGALKDEIASKETAIQTLRTELAEYAGLKHDSLVAEAARLATELGRAIAKDKSFDELCGALTVRTDESLSDMIVDAKSELETKEAAEPKTEVPVVEQVEDPTVTIVTEGAAPAPQKSVEEIADELHSTITEDKSAAEVYSLIFEEDEYKAIFQPDAS
jgi:hypothetical protein